MPWVKLDDRFSEHPKWGNAPSCDVHWFLFALCYCNRNLTDGFIPAGVAERLTPGHQQIEVEALPFRVIRRLIDLGVISEKEKRGIAGYEIHDFLGLGHGVLLRESTDDGILPVEQDYRGRNPLVFRIRDDLGLSVRIDVSDGRECRP